MGEERPPAPPWRFVFLLEESLGHRTHSHNLERSLDGLAGLYSTVIMLGAVSRGGSASLPLARNWSVQASWRARSALRGRTLGSDAIFIHTQVAALFARSVMRQVPTVVSLDATPRNFDSVGEAYGHRQGSAVVESVKLAYNRRVFAAATALVCWSQWAAASLVDDYGVAADKINVIPPGVDLDLLTPADRKRSAGPLRVLFVGGDFERKGGWDLITGMLPLGRVAELDVVTSADFPPVPPGLTCRIHRGVAAGSPEIVDLFRNADVFALPSHSETFGIAIAEALACGLPVISCPVGAIPELVMDGVNGCLVPIGSPGRISEALEMLVGHPDRRLEMGRQSRLLAQRKHDMRRSHAAIVDLMVRLGSRWRTARGLPAPPGELTGELVDSGAPRAGTGSWSVATPPGRFR